MKNFLSKIVLTLLLLPFTLAAKQPNIVFILSDDAGFEEFGVYKVKKGIASNTPNIDALAERGVVFKQAWTQAICGPSRSMVLSGNYAVHNGAYDNKIYYLKNPEDYKRKDRLPSFTKVLKDAGYAVAVAGKWHNPAGFDILTNSKDLGVDSYTVWNADPKPFEEILGKKLVPDSTWEASAITGAPKISRYWKPGIIENGKVLTTTMKDYGPDIFSDAIVDFIDEQAKAKKPFLAYYTMVLPHGAHTPTPDDVAKGAVASNKTVPKGTEQGAKNFLSQMNYADKLVGKIVNKIEQLGITEDTYIVYASDNGTTSSAKGKAVEYGVHVPFVVAGADVKQRGMTDELMDFTDVLPTFAELADTKIPGHFNVDGQSMAAFLKGKSDSTKDVIYSFPGPGSLVRTKDYLLEAVAPIYGQPEGRLYKTNGSYDGRGYENITHNIEYANIKKKMLAHLVAMENPLPTSFDDPIWVNSKKMIKGKKFFDNKKRAKKHLELPKDYKFYDESF
ncbi:sulfatase-like hydrolase/transferase [Thalassotalea fonticola]|uniref:Sulfatase-like hydrolase/transferase n=1 Tax=Thalassotalea fonticola TaxID=3065649 RepID=A0ABZ0GV96_9GAMM|nr:sulfatase-like hydrolase/transferase [Colwelliaceae bacterium S1-1]